MDRRQQESAALGESLSKENFCQLEAVVFGESLSIGRQQFSKNRWQRKIVIFEESLSMEVVLSEKFFVSGKLLSIGNPFIWGICC